MKKLIITFLSLIFVSMSILAIDVSAVCKYDGGTDWVSWAPVWDQLTECLKDSSVVQTSDNLALEGTGFSATLQNWIDNFSIYLYVFAIGAIVYGGLMMTLSTGDDEKIKKAKDIVIWGIVWFIALISITALLQLIVSVIYWIDA